jgi:hypothetical protein
VPGMCQVVIIDPPLTTSILSEQVELLHRLSRRGLDGRLPRELDPSWRAG